MLSMLQELHKTSSQATYSLFMLTQIIGHTSPTTFSTFSREEIRSCRSSGPAGEALLEEPGQGLLICGLRGDLGLLRLGSLSLGAGAHRGRFVEQLRHGHVELARHGLVEHMPESVENVQVVLGAASWRAGPRCQLRPAGGPRGAWTAWAASQRPSGADRGQALGEMAWAQMATIAFYI